MSSRIRGPGPPGEYTMIRRAFAHSPSRWVRRRRPGGFRAPPRALKLSVGNVKTEVGERGAVGKLTADPPPLKRLRALPNGRAGAPPGTGAPPPLSPPDAPPK